MSISTVKHLHITNGDSALAIMQAAGIDGVILPWRDVLHDGPVPSGLTLTELSRVRAGYISSVGWGDFDDVYASFCERDDVLQGSKYYDQISLWYEHDLYDQLQVLQILDALADEQLPSTSVTLACSDKYLGEMEPAEMLEFQSEQQAVTVSQFALAQRAWAAFRQESPVAWALLRVEDLSVLPFLYDTIERSLQELPDSKSGVSRTGMQILAIVAEGEVHPGYVFAENQKREKRIFLGDSSFWLVVDRLVSTPHSLLTLNHGVLGYPPDPTQRLALTVMGEQVLSGQKSWLDYTSPDYFMGGVHCHAESLWCFDLEANTVACY